MIRRIKCKNCVRLTVHPEDAAEGWVQRVRWVIVQKPENLAITTTTVETGETKVHRLATVHCDDCNIRIPDGEKAACVTQWRPPQPEPQAWEHEYGEEAK